MHKAHEDVAWLQYNLSVLNRCALPVILEEVKCGMQAGDRSKIHITDPQKDSYF